MSIRARARYEIDADAEGAPAAMLDHAATLDSILVQAFDMWMSRAIRNVTISIGDGVHLDADTVESVFAAMNEVRVAAETRAPVPA